MKISKLVAKHFLVLSRFPLGSLLIIIGPLLVLLLAGFAYNNNARFDLTVSTFVSEESELTQELLSALAVDFATAPYDSLEECISSVKAVQSHACLAFSPDFVLGQGKQNVIAVYVDNSKVNIVDLIRNSLHTVIASESSEITTDLTETLVVTLQQADADIISWRDGELLNASAGLLTQKNFVDIAKSKLSNQDYAFDSPTQASAKITSAFSKVESDISSLSTSAKNSATKTLELIAEVEASNISGLSSEISSAKSAANTLLSLSNGSSLNTTSSIASGVSELSTYVTSLLTKLDDSKATSQSVSTSLSSVALELSSITNSLVTLSEEMTQTSRTIRGIKITAVESIVAPIVTQVNPIVTTSSKLHFLFSSFVLLVLLFVCVMLGCILVISEKLSAAKFRVYLTPTSDWVLITSIFITTMIIAFLQIMALFAVGQYVFYLPIIDQVWTMALLAICASAIFTLIGMSIGYIFQDEQTAILAAISLCSGFILISDLILPLEAIEGVIRAVIDYSPFVLLTTLMRRVFLFDATLQNLVPHIWYVVIYLVALFVIIVAAHKIVKTIYIIQSKARQRGK